MKELMLLVSAMLLTLSLRAQSTDTSVVRIYGGPETETLADMVQIGHHIYLIGTYGSGGHGMSDVYVIKTDTLGNVIWTRAFGSYAVDQPKAAAAMGDTALIIVGYTNYIFDQAYDGLALCVDTTGNQRWWRTFGNTDWDFFNSVLVDDVGQIVAVGETYLPGQGQSDAWLLKLDAQGNQLLNKSYGGPKLDRFDSIDLLNGNEYVIAGTFESGAIDSTDIAIYRTDLQGNVLHTAMHGGTGREIVNKVKVAWSDNILIAGAGTTNGAGKFDFLLIRTDLSGNVTWYDQFGGPDDEMWRDAFISPQGVVMATGHSVSQIGGGGIETFTYRYAGWAQQLLTFGGFKDDFGMAILPSTYENTYMVAGYTGSFGCGNDDIFLFRSRQNGGVYDSSYVSNCDQIDPLIGIADQPSAIANDILINPTKSGYSVTGPNNQKIEVSLYDTSGRVLFATSSTHVFIPENRFAPGLNIISARSGKSVRVIRVTRCWQP